MEIEYGLTDNIRRFLMDLAPSRVANENQRPAAVDPHAATKKALTEPIEFPPMTQAVIPDDTIVLAVDTGTPAAPAMVAEVWKQLEARGVSAEQISILQPADAATLPDPRTQLPANVAAAIEWKFHDPDSENGCAYLASSSRGERIYLARDLVESDFVLPIGPIAFDPLLGFRGTGSVLYPWLSNKDAIQKARGQGHSELQPSNTRPLRQLIDELAWLLGTQFSVQSIAAGGSEAAAILGGATDAVFRTGRERLAELWTFEVSERADIVVVGVEEDAAGHGWKQLASALATARSLVSREGRVVILSSVDQPLTTGLEMIRAAESPLDAIKPIRLESPDDTVVATQLANAVDWARVYLLSELDDDIVEDMFMVPLSDEDEVRRLLESNDDSITVVHAAQHVHASVR